MAMGALSGSERYTADKALGSSTAPVRVFNVSYLSGGTAGVLVLRNGTTASGDIWIHETGTISRTETINFEGGILFTDGLFFDKDTNVSSVVISYRLEN